MGDIVEKIKFNQKDTPSRRIGDINIIYLASVVEDLKKKLENEITGKLDKVWEKVNSLPCSAHMELIKRIEEISNLKMKSMVQDILDVPKTNRALINWLFIMYGTVIAGLVTIITIMLKVKGG